MASRPTLKSFKAWAEDAQPGDKFVYEPTGQQLTFARKLFDADKVILFQRPVNVRFDNGAPAGRYFEHVAERVSDRASGWLKRMSAATPAPYNRFAHEEGLRIASA